MKTMELLEIAARASAAIWVDAAALLAGYANLPLSFVPNAGAAENGVDRVYSGYQKPPEYDFVESPVKRPWPIRLRFFGGDSPSRDARGNLMLGPG